MSVTPCSSSFAGIGSCAPLGHARAALRAGVPQDEHGVGVDVERGVVDARRDVVDVLEHDARGRDGGGGAGDAALRLITAPSGRGSRGRRRAPLARRAASASGAITSRSWSRPPSSLARRASAPVTVSASRWSSGAELVQHRAERRRRGAGPRPGARPTAARWRSRGVVRESSSKRSSVERRRRRDPRARAGGSTAFVPPPIAISSRDRVVERRGGQDLRRAQPLRARSRPRGARRLGRAVARGVARRGWSPSPGSDMPSASTSAAIVDAVPISLQWPERRRRRRLELVELLLRHAAGAQLVGVVPEVRSRLRARARGSTAGSDGPPVSMIAGHVGARGAHQLRPAPSCRSRRSARPRRAGTTRIDSSTSIAIRFR